MLLLQYWKNQYFYSEIYFILHFGGTNVILADILYDAHTDPFF